MVWAYLELIPSSLVQSLIYGFVTLGVMLPFRILNFPDLTCEGAFPLGAAVCGVLLAAGWNPIIAMAFAGVAGALAGTATSVVYQVTKVNTLLCGIIISIMLYSINLRIMGHPNIALFSFDNVFQLTLGGASTNLWGQAVFLAIAIAVTGVVILWFFTTEIGVAMRTIGSSVLMARAQGINVAVYTAVGLALANALTAISGAILAQYQGFADIGIGTGVLIGGLAAGMLGEALVGTDTLVRQIFGPILGTILFFQAVSVALAVGFQPSDLKLLTGMFVLATLLVPNVRTGLGRRKVNRPGAASGPTALSADG